MSLSHLADKIRQFPESVIAREIYNHIVVDEIKQAKILYQNDGDKVTQYDGLREAIEGCLGCRLHGNFNCVRWPCTLRLVT